MKFLNALLITVILTSATAFAAEKTSPVSKGTKAPVGLSKEITAALNPESFQISVPDGPNLQVWFIKNLAAQPSFKPSLNVKYPFTPGQLIGAIQIAKGSNFSDFRAQEIPAGVYTLRYGQQPEDGNHIGTSEIYDFLLALPAKVDKSPLAINFADQLTSKSAESAGSSHPAIFSLLPAEKKIKKASLTHDENHDFWIFNVACPIKKGGKNAIVPLRVVVVGHAEE